MYWFIVLHAVYDKIWRYGLFNVFFIINFSQVYFLKIIQMSTFSGTSCRLNCCWSAQTDRLYLFIYKIIFFFFSILIPTIILKLNSRAPNGKAPEKFTIASLRSCYYILHFTGIEIALYLMWYYRKTVYSFKYYFNALLCVAT